MTTEQNAIRPNELQLLLHRREPFVLLDVRNQEDFERWRIETHPDVQVRNIPYFQFVENPDQAVAQLPSDKLVVAVCAKGGSSQWVVQEILRPRGFRAVNLNGGMLAWAQYYQARELPESPPHLRIYQFDRVARGCLHYVVVYGPNHKHAIVIDPPRHTEPILDLVQHNQVVITHIIDTHAHADHISGGVALSRATSAPYYLHPYDGIHPLDVLPATIPYEMLKDGMRFDLAGAKLQVLHIPGHTLGNTALLLEDSGRTYLFSGDSIFLRSIARPDLGGHAETWTPLHYRSIFGRLLELPDETIVLPAHYSRSQEARKDGLFTATLQELKQRNADLQPRSESQFREYILNSLPDFPHQYVDIKRVNLGLLSAHEEFLDELELGKNVCALATAYKG